MMTSYAAPSRGSSCATAAPGRLGCSTSSMNVAAARFAAAPIAPVRPTARRFRGLGASLIACLPPKTCHTRPGPPFPRVPALSRNLGLG